MDKDNTGGGQNGDKQLPELKVVTDSYDPYEFEQDTQTPYSRERFYTKSRDKTGEKDNVRVQFPGGLGHEVDALIAEKIIPEYATRQDFVRDAIVHRLHDIAEMKEMGRLSRRMNPLILQMEMEQLKADVESSRATVQITEAMLTGSATSSDWVAVGMALERGFMQIGTLREPYQSQLRDILRSYEQRYQDQRNSRSKHPNHPSNQQ